MISNSAIYNDDYSKSQYCIYSLFVIAHKQDIDCSKLIDDYIGKHALINRSNDRGQGDQEDHAAKTSTTPDVRKFFSKIRKRHFLSEMQKNFQKLEKGCHLSRISNILYFLYNFLYSRFQFFITLLLKRRTPPISNDSEAPWNNTHTLLKTNPPFGKRRGRSFCADTRGNV